MWNISYAIIGFISWIYSLVYFSSNLFVWHWLSDKVMLKWRLATLLNWWCEENKLLNRLCSDNKKYFHSPCFSVSIVNFEGVIPGRV